jgi:hypothetical protein
MGEDAPESVPDMVKSNCHVKPFQTAGARISCFRMSVMNVDLAGKDIII